MRSDVRSITDIWANHTVAMCNVTMDSVSDSERLCGQTRYFFFGAHRSSLCFHYTLNRRLFKLKSNDALSQFSRRLACIIVPHVFAFAQRRSHAHIGWLHLGGP